MRPDPSVPKLPPQVLAGLLLVLCSFRVPALQGSGLASEAGCGEVPTPNARAPGVGFTRTSPVFPPLPLKLLDQRGGLVPLRRPRRQCGQGEQSCAVVGLLTRLHGREQIAAGGRSGRGSALAGGVLAVAPTSREEREPGGSVAF